MSSVNQGQGDCEEQRTSAAAALANLQSAPSFSIWRARTRVVAFLDMIFSWIWIGFCASFFIKLTLTLAMTNDENWNIDVQYGKLIIATLWITLLAAILGKCLGLWTLMKLIQAVYFAQDKRQGDKLTISWRCYSSTSLLLCPVVIIALNTAIYFIPSNAEFVAFLISFMVLLGFGWVWRASSFLVVNRFLKELETSTTTHTSPTS